MRWIGCGVSLALALAGCAGEKTPSPAPAEPTAATTTTLSGTLHLDNGQLRFVACNESGDGRTLHDRPDGEATALIGEMAPAEGRLTVVLRLTGDSVTEVRYAGPEGPRCGELPPEGIVSASGTEPFWHLRIAGDSATITTPEEIGGVTWYGGKWDAAHLNHRRFTAVREGGDTLVLALSEERCADGMSGARYPWRATITQRGTTMTGCALEGRDAAAMAP